MNKEASQSDWQSLGQFATNRQPSAGSQDAPEPGMMLGNFRLEIPLGRGGMGEVWRAVDQVGERTVVIKFVPPELRRFPDELARVKHSFKRVHALQHQHICPTYMLDEDPRCGVYLVMKFIDGETLHDYRQRFAVERGEFPLSEVKRLLGPVAQALDYAHANKLVHRDVKPQNIMVSQDGSDVQLVDFGLVAEFRSSLTRVSRQQMDSSGTYPYMAPEQWRGQFQNAATDQYALGVVAYELLSGRFPFEAVDEFVLRQCVLMEPIEPLEDQPAFVNEALGKAMAKKRKDRYPNCQEFVEALAPAKRENLEPVIKRSRSRRESGHTSIVEEPVNRDGADSKAHTSAKVGHPGKKRRSRGSRKKKPKTQPALAPPERNEAAPKTQPADAQANGGCMACFAVMAVLLIVAWANWTRICEFAESGFAAGPSELFSVSASDSLRAVAVSKTGSRVATAGLSYSSATRRDRLVIWNSKTGDPLLRLDAPSDARDVAFSSDGLSLAVVGDGFGGVFDVVSGEQYLELQGYQGGRSVCFNPDDSLIAAARDGKVFVYDANNGKLKFTVEHGQSVNDVCFSPDGTMGALASSEPSGGAGGVAMVWDSRNGKPMQTFHGHTSSVMSVAFSPDSKTVASGCYDHIVRLWTPRDGREVASFRGHNNAVVSIDFDDSGRYVASCGIHSDGVIVWDVDSQKERLRIDSDPQSAAFGRRGILALTSGKDLKAWDINTILSP